MTVPDVASVRDRLDSVDIVSFAILALVIHASTDGAGEVLLSVAVLAVAMPVFGWLFDAANIGDVGARLLLGSLVAALGVAALVRGESPLVGAGALAVGCWFVLDACYEHRHGDPTGEGAADGTDEDFSEAEMYTLMGHGQWVLEELREASRPLTAAELRARTGLTEAELEDVLEMTLGNGTVERVGNGYAVDETELGGVAFVRGIVRTVGGRLLRPFRVFRPSG